MHWPREVQGNWQHYPSNRGKDAFSRIRLWHVLCC